MSSASLSLQPLCRGLGKASTKLTYNEETDRYRIRFNLTSYSSDLHCGQCFEVLVNGHWKLTRIEYDCRWYLIGIKTTDLQGLQVRV